MTQLCEIAEKYMTDRCPKYMHHYTEYYYAEFNDRREQVRKVLEIGVGGSPDNRKHNPNYITGAGLYMWREFFPNAMIYGVDVRPNLMFETERIKTFLCDQRDTEGLVSILDITGVDIDLVIDDASHRPDDQVSSALAIVPRLQKGALYVIEDVADPSIMERLSRFDPKLVEPWKRFKRDDRLVVIRVGR